MKKSATIMTFSLLLTCAAAPAFAQMSGMDMSMEKPATGIPTRQAYTTNHAFLVKLVSVPNPIPYEKYFKMSFAVYDGANPAKKLSDAQVSMFAGMRHGMTTGFAHGMQSSPKVTEQNGVVTASGMYFHMMGPWTVEVTVHDGGKSGVADFQLPCCAQ